MKKIMEIITERLEREFDLDIITTTPSVRYRLTMTDGTVESNVRLFGKPFGGGSKAVFRFRFPRCFQPVATALFRKDLNPNFLIKALFLSPYYHRFSEMSTPKKRVFHINSSSSIIVDSKMSIYAYNLCRGDTLALGK